MDRITTSLLKKFISDYSLESLHEDTAFEYFTSYLVTSLHYEETFEPSDIVTGSGQDNAIDGLSIIINGSLAIEPEEVDDMASSSTYLDVNFIFIQSERSASFDMQKIGHFGFGVVDLFTEDSKIKKNEFIQIKKRIIDRIYENSSKFKNYKPKIDLYYITTGKWVNDNNLLQRSKSVESDLIETNLFSSVEFKFIDADAIQSINRKVNASASIEIKMQNFIVLPEVKEIDQSYIGYLSSEEFLKLLSNNEGNINQSIFYDNVRDWQELNSVNKEITETIQSINDQSYFHLLNNGVTIVADKIIPSGIKFYLEDYQIVNGCQTSYAIFENKGYIRSCVTIPVRLIGTKNPEIKNKIIKATNRQTPISDEMLYALSELPKKLEQYFVTFLGNGKLYFERRPKQYSRDDSVEKIRVINLQTLVRSFASFYLLVPHQTTRNYKALLKANNEVIFNKNNVLEMYYLCCYGYYKLEKMFRKKTIDSKFKPARWHILMCFIKSQYKEKLPTFNSHDMSRLCEQLVKVLNNDGECDKEFLKCVDIIKDAAKDNYDRDNIRTEPFTKSVLSKIK